jgi:hypothetical protein
MGEACVIRSLCILPVIINIDTQSIVGGLLQAQQPIPNAVRCDLSHRLGTHRAYRYKWGLLLGQNVKPGDGGGTTVRGAVHGMNYLRSCPVAICWNIDGPTGNSWLVWEYIAL